MRKGLLAGFFVLAIAGPALADYQMPAQPHPFVANNGGHPDPCWSLRIQKMVTRSAHWRDLFEAYLARYNFNN